MIIKISMRKMAIEWEQVTEAENSKKVVTT